MTNGGESWVERAARDTEQPQIPDDLSQAQVSSRAIMSEYQQNRINWYEQLALKKVLQKDIAMFAARGIDTADEFIEESFRAVESSSEETVMGNHWQRILAQISHGTLDTGDLTTVREGDLWVCEVKSQPNTTNSSSFPQELRSLRTRQEEIARRRRASNQKVLAAYCILRDQRGSGRGIDESRVYGSDNPLPENSDLQGFEYRYISGKQFWKWLTGFESEVALLMPLADMQDKGKEVKLAREAAKERLQEELRAELHEHGLSDSIDDVVRLRDLY